MYQDTIQELRDECEMLRKQIADIEFHNHNMQAMTFEMKNLFDKAMKDKNKDVDAVMPYTMNSIKSHKSEQKSSGVMFPAIVNTTEKRII